MITALAANELRARGFASDAVVSERDLQRGIDGFGAGVREEHVIEARRRDLYHGIGQCEGRRVPNLEGRRVVHRLELRGNRLRDLFAAVSGVNTPEAGDTVQNLAAFRGPVVHAAGLRQDAGLRLELAVGGERHPVGFEVAAGGRLGEWRWA